MKFQKAGEKRVVTAVYDGHVTDRKMSAEVGDRMTFPEDFAVTKSLPVGVLSP